jgi:sulfur-oxidizing protein SoxA
MLCALVGLFILVASGSTIQQANAQDRAEIVPPPGSALTAPVSGYFFRNKHTRAMQDDDMSNPGYLWIDEGSDLWSTVEGKAGKACADCHGTAEESMRSPGVSYPKYDPAAGRLINLEQRINRCRTENMQAPAWQWESRELLSITAYVRHQSRGLQVKIAIDGPARPFFEQGKAFFYRRLGQLDMSCAQCHEKYAGKHLRANLLSQAHINGFPIYSLGFQRTISLHELFRHCTKKMRATPYDLGAEEYVNLELYMAWRGNGLPVETPAVR